MPSHSKLEVAVGAFVVSGLLGLAYLSLTLGGLPLGGGNRYPLTARFSSVGGLKPGDPVKVAGVSIGEVARIRLADFTAQVELRVDPELRLPKDTIASIQSAGLLGDAYVSLSPGAAAEDLQPGASISRTEAAVNLFDLVAKYAFGTRSGGDAPAAASSDASRDGALPDLLE